MEIEASDVVQKSYSGGDPSVADVHTDVPLTNFAQQFAMEETHFVAMRALASISTPKNSGQYYNYNRGDFFRDEVKNREAGTETNATSGYGLTKDNYFIPVFGCHIDISDQAEANQDPVLDIGDRDASTFVTHKLLIFRDVALRDKAFIDNVWENGTGAAAAGDTTQNWSSVSSTPIAAIDNARTAMQSRTGMRANSMIISRQAYDVLKNNADVLSRVNGGVTPSDPAKVTEAQIAALLEIENFFVVDSVVNSAVKGATESVNFIFSDDALLYYTDRVGGVAPGGTASNLTPKAFVNFNWNGYMGGTGDGMRISRFDVELKRSTRIEGEMAFVQKITSPSLGYLWKGVTA